MTNRHRTTTPSRIHTRLYSEWTSEKVGKLTSGTWAVQRSVSPLKTYPRETIQHVHTLVLSRDDRLSADSCSQQKHMPAEVKQALVLLRCMAHCNLPSILMLAWCSKRQHHHSVSKVMRRVQLMMCLGQSSIVSLNDEGMSRPFKITTDCPCDLFDSQWSSSNYKSWITNVLDKTFSVGSKL